MISVGNHVIRIEVHAFVFENRVVANLQNGKGMLQAIHNARQPINAYHVLFLHTQQ
jgi:hypothetical protein